MDKAWNTYIDIASRIYAGSLSTFDYKNIDNLPSQGDQEVLASFALEAAEVFLDRAGKRRAGPAGDVTRRDSIKIALK